MDFRHLENLGNARKLLMEGGFADQPTALEDEAALQHGIYSVAADWSARFKPWNDALDLVTGKKSAFLSGSLTESTDAPEEGLESLIDRMGRLMEMKSKRSV